MTEAKLIELDGDQVVLLPPEFQLPGKWIRIRKSGDAVILEPVRGLFGNVIEWIRARMAGR